MRPYPLTFSFTFFLWSAYLFNFTFRPVEGATFDSTAIHYFSSRPRLSPGGTEGEEFLKFRGPGGSALHSFKPLFSNCCGGHLAVTVGRIQRGV